MAPLRYTPPTQNERETVNHSARNNHIRIFRNRHWTNEPNHMNWETYHRLQNQLIQLEMEVLIWSIEITVRPSSNEHIEHLNKMKRLYLLTQTRLNTLTQYQSNNSCPYCVTDETENNSSNENNSTSNNRQ